MARTHLRKRILLPLLVLSLTTGVFLAVQLAEADQDRWDLSPEVQADLLARYPKEIALVEELWDIQVDRIDESTRERHHPHRQPPPRSLLSVLRTDDRNFSGQAWLLEHEEMKGTHITPRQVRNALAAVFLLLLLLFLSLFQWYQRADTRLEDIAAQNGWDCLGAADRLATHLKRGTYDYMTIDAIARFDETAQHAQQPTWGQLGEVLVELENEIAFTAIPPREMQKITAYLNGLTGPPHQRRCWRSPPSFA